MVCSLHSRFTDPGTNSLARSADCRSPTRTPPCHHCFPQSRFHDWYVASSPSRRSRGFAAPLPSENLSKLISPDSLPRLVGRDKLYRAIQYFARFLAFCTSCPFPFSLGEFRSFQLLNRFRLTDCLRKGYSNETVARLSALKSTLGMSRKRKKKSHSLLPPFGSFGTKTS